MSVAPTGGTTPFKPPFKWWSARATAVTVLVLTAVTGVLLGVALDRQLLLSRRGGYGAHGWHRGWFGDRPMLHHGSPAAAVHQASERLARTLDLTDAQRVQVDSIMVRHMTAFHDVRREAEARVRVVLEATRQAIDSVLTPQQRERFRTLHHGWKTPTAQ